MVRTEIAARVGAAPKRIARSGYGALRGLGDHLVFYGKVFGWSGRTLRRYRLEIARLIAQVSLGRGGLALVAGTVGIIMLQTMSVGAVIGLAAHEGLRQIGAEAFMGFISAFYNTREAAPLVAASALIATVGAGFTAELGAMRAAEEIDALEVMAVPSIPYLITTRLIAMLVAAVPLYVIALMSSYLATRAVTIDYFGQSAGVYDHYFNLFLPPIDILYSFAKVIVFSVVIALVMCYYGYHASGGPAGVGVAVGRAVRLVMVLTVVIDFLLNLAMWGSTTTVRIGG